MNWLSGMVLFLGACGPSPKELAQVLENPRLLDSGLEVILDWRDPLGTEDRPGPGRLEGRITDHLRALIPMTLDGRALRVVLDSGWGGRPLSLTTKAADSLNLNLSEPQGGANTPNKPLTNPGSYRRSEGHELRIGPLKLLAQSVDVLENLDAFSTDYFDGFVGARILRYFKVTLDGPNRKVWLDLHASKEADAEPFFLGLPKPVVWYELDGRRRRALFDTGSNGGLQLNSNFNLDPYRQPGRIWQKSGVFQGLSGEPLTELTAVRLGAVRIQGKVFRSPEAWLNPWVNEQSFDNLGLAFFSGSVVELNFPQGLWRLVEGPR